MEYVYILNKGNMVNKTNFIPQSVYPFDYDTDFELFDVYNTAQSTIASNNEPWSTTIYVVPKKIGESEVWADNGFVTLDGELIYYSSVDRDYVTGHVNTFKNCIRNIGGKQTHYNPAGTPIRGFVVSYHHNNLAAAIVKIQDKLGVAGSTDQKALTNVVNRLLDEMSYREEVNVPDVTLIVTPIQKLPGGGTRIHYEFEINGPHTDYEIDFGDGTSTTDEPSGDHDYGADIPPQPVAIINYPGGSTTITPPFYGNADVPVVVFPPAPINIIIPEIPPVPNFNLTLCDVPNININFPPIIFPDLNVTQISNISIPSIITFSNNPYIPSIVEFSELPNPIPSIINFGPVTVPTTITVSYISFISPTVIDVNSNIPSIINVVGATPSVITFSNTIPSIITLSSTIPSIINVVGVDNLPSIITFANSPTFPSIINITGAVSFPSIVTFVNAPTIPSIVTVIGGSSIPSVINVISDPITVDFGNVPDLFVDFGQPPEIPPIDINVPEIPPIQFAPIPAFPPVQFDVPTIPPITVTGFPTSIPIAFQDPPILQVDWGTPPTISATVNLVCNSNVGGGTGTGFLGTSNLPSGGNNSLSIDPPDLSFFSQSVDDIPSDVKPNYNNTVNIPVEYQSFTSIPSVINFGEMPRFETMRVEHDIPTSIAVTGFEKEINVNFSQKIPDKISFVGNIPNEIMLIGANLIPPSIEVTGMKIPESIKLESDFRIPDVIKIDYGNFPGVISVIGMPQFLEVKHDIPKSITIEPPEDFKIPFVYSGPPLEVKATLDYKGFIGDNDDEQTCFAIIPCAPKK